MAQTIDVEARKLANLSVDPDKFRRQYISRDGDYKIQFVSPLYTTYEKHRFYLLSKSIKVKLDHKYWYRPDSLSKDVYGVTSMWQLLMLLNNVMSIDEFSLEEVLIPSYDSILEISKDNKNLPLPLDLDKIQTNNNSGYIDVYTPISAPVI